MNRNQSTVRKWVAALGFAALVGGVTIYLLLFHLAMGIPISDLWEAFLLHSLAALVLAPFMYEADRRRSRDDRSQFGWFFASLGVYCVAVLLCWTFFGLRAGVIPTALRNVCYAGAILGPGLASIAAYFIRKKIWIKRHDDRHLG
jgi:uncharacterized membrane-anchored protein